VAALVFGAAHLDNGGFPNLRYALLATLAGVFYGRAFRQGGSLMPAALVHTLVDSVWVALFR
jgi:membrane protease YdiL (CAAX protease family)